ncbi:hypothetical protein CYMTET_29215 [Cymbomonas tetramitiformis]|uniref:Gamma-tubulin complex component n=1 Tax=Cymbomonas tetramitiformis TaxID=36881 RepID=A0AAE0FMY5_9CHLO|nr:hypothetical protein CYMTET_29215 [Cymbomonas tetramitiformis]
MLHACSTFFRACRGTSKPGAGCRRAEYDPAKRSHEERIDAAFQFASKELLKLLKEDYQLEARLRSIKHYFLLDQGDYLVHFMDIAGEELNKMDKEISVPRLQSLLELALRTSVAASDEHNEDLTCGLEKASIIDQLLSIFTVADDSHPPRAAAKAQFLHGWDTFTLDYVAQWPVSLVLSRTALTKYQLLFRHLFHCKHVERQLGHTWQHHQATRLVSTVGGSLTRAYCLCQRMMHFLQNFEYYMTVEVLEPNWHVMDSRLRAASTVDEVMTCHDEFLDACMKESMLFWPKILRRLEKIKMLCINFVQASQRLIPAVCTHLPRGGEEGPINLTGDRSMKRAREKEALEHARKIAADPTFSESIRQLEEQFHAQLGDLIKMLNMSTHLEPNLASLCARLDFNNFFTE